MDDIGLWEINETFAASLVHRRGKKWGVALMCVGGGQGVAGLFEIS